MTPQHAAQLRALLHEKAKRRAAALALYEPLPVQASFHASRARVNVVRGSNRSGKTLCAAVEVARAVTGRDPYGKYPREGGRCFCVGKDLAHVGEVMWRKLAGSGVGKSPFKMIRDSTSGQWRGYRPWDALDLAREEQAQPCPPLIPSSLIAKISWEDKKEEIPSKVVLTNGWELNFFSSLGKPPQGSDIDLWWFDEEIVDPSWFPEMVARTLDRKGRGIWSATPQAGTEALFDLHERAERCQWQENPDVREFVVLLCDNPHVGEVEKRTLAEHLTEEERRVRIEGEFAFISFRVYPEFNVLIHGVDLEGDLPADWTRYLVIDPGHQVCGVLFAAVPPPSVDPEQVVLFDELYLRECDAARFAAAVAAKCEGTCVQASLMDPNAAVQTEMGSGKTVAQQYTEALQAAGFSAVGTGAGFILACDDREAGRLRVHHLLRSRDDGRGPRLRVARGRCPNLEFEFKRYVKKRVQGVVLDEPNERRHSHLMHCLRYLALYGPRWVKPRAVKEQPTWAVKALRAKQARAKSRQGGSFVNLGPGGGER